MLVVIGSKNQIKVNAVRWAFESLFDKPEFESLEVDSGVSKMPMSANETIKGSENRALNALSLKGAEFGVGVEGGVEETALGMMLCSYVTIINKNGVRGTGGGTSVRIPDPIAKRVREGEELGIVMDDFSGMKDTKHGSGAIGILTKNLVDRENFFRMATACALSPFIKPEFYENR